MRKDDLDKLIKKYKVQPVGNGYIDCIVSLENVFDFIDDLSRFNINAYGLTWWCHCKDKNPSCPHGMGGPLSKYYEGWFSEINLPLIEIENNTHATAYISAPNDKRVLECFVPALWIDVPDDWRNELL